MKITKARLASAWTALKNPPARVPTISVKLDPPYLAKCIKIIDLYADNGVHEFKEILRAGFWRFRFQLNEMYPYLKCAYIYYHSFVPTEVRSQMDDLESLHDIKIRSLMNVFSDAQEIMREELTDNIIDYWKDNLPEKYDKLEAECRVKTKACKIAKKVMAYLQTLREEGWSDEFIWELARSKFAFLSKENGLYWQKETEKELWKERFAWEFTNECADLRYRIMQYQSGERDFLDRSPDELMNY